MGAPCTFSLLLGYTEGDIVDWLRPNTLLSGSLAQVAFDVSAL
jgi:hypothetical protein